MMAQVFDSTPCTLGEGPLWHPGLGCLFWFDIIGKRLYQRQGDTTRHWQFDEHVSAAGWIDDDRLLIASETRLFTFTLSTGLQDTQCSLEADRPETRSNDGRADPFGGFWIGTMAKDAAKDQGAIYRFFKGELRRLVAPVSISNAISFHPDRRHACFTDTPTGIIMRVTLDDQGWPDADPEPWIDFTPMGLRPDGAVFDAAGNFWVAFWGAGAVASFGPDGKEIARHGFPAAQTTCPAFGGADMTTLFCTSAARDDATPGAGQTFASPTRTTGQTEHRVILHP